MKRFLLQSLRRVLTRKRITRLGKEDFFPACDDTFRQTAFTFAVIALAAKLLQSGGPVAEKDFSFFHAVFPLPQEEHEKTRRLFWNACTDSVKASHYARQIVLLFPERDTLLRELMTLLFRLATARGPLTLAKKQWLKEIAGILGVSRKAMEQMLTPVAATASADPYTLLGVTRKASFDEIKQAYRRHIRELHPDSLAAKGYAPEAVAEADGELALINAAYQVLVRKPT